MGITKKRYNSECVLFRKRFKKPLNAVASVMPKGFTNEQFKKEFKYLYSYLWDEIGVKYEFYKQMDMGRKRKGIKEIYHFPSPNKYFYEISSTCISRLRTRHESDDCVLDRQFQEQNRRELRRKCMRKERQRLMKRNNNMKYVQTVTPEYTNYYIQEYFNVKHSNPADIDTRYVILCEAAKYKCPATLQFLHKVNASERNYNLRYFAFHILQKWGEQVRLRKNRMGKIKVGDREHFNDIDTPSALLSAVYSSQLEQQKHFDVFLSHSSLDANMLLELKACLNSNGLNVYIDWMSDRSSLKRELLQKSTAEVLLKRMNASTTLLYVYTENSNKSCWMPWELGYFHGLGRKICVFVPEEIERPMYLNLYPDAILEEGCFYVKDDDSKIELADWIDE